MRQVARNHGLVYDGRARQFERRDFERFDLILAMDNENLGHLRWMAARPEDLNKLHLLREFDPEGGATQASLMQPAADVPDPYYEGIEGFERVYEIIERSCRNLLDALERGDVPGL
jgi:protein-tyrosine phosphatase